MKFTQPLTKEQQHLVEEYLRLVHWTIQQYIDVNESVCGLGYDDLYQEGALALCHAAATFEDRGTQFKSYAIPVIRNHLLDHCRRISTQRKNMPMLSLDVPPCEGRPPTAYDDTEERLSDIYASQLLEYGKRTYSGVAKLGIEALELKSMGYSGADIAKLYGTKATHVGAWISRAAAKLREDPITAELALLCVENRGV